MASTLETLELIAQQKQAIPAIDASRCVAVRHRLATCKACVKACPANAITIENNQIKHDPYACLNCGACTSVCPTEAFTPQDELFDPLFNALSAAETAPETIVFCCEKNPYRANSPKTSTLFFTLPCLAYLDERTLFQCAQAGCLSLGFAQTPCLECEKQASQKTFLSFLERTFELLEATNTTCVLTRYEEHVEESLPEQVSRRGFFTSLASEIKQAASQTATTSIESTLGQKDAPETLAQQLTSAPGVLKTFRVKRNETFLDCLYQALSERSHTIEVHETPDLPRFGLAKLDTSTCQHCGMCAKFCPTGALCYVGERQTPSIFGSKTNGVHGYHEFRCSDCINCNLCADICLNDALSISSASSFEKLFDLEPKKLS